MSSSEPVRFGIVGSGWITDTHVKALRDIPAHAEIVALGDYPRDRGGRPGRGEAFAAANGIATYHADYRRMLEDRSVEAVVVGLPNLRHAEVVLAALEAGKHVVVEKPLCTSLDDADEIVALAAAKRLAVGYAEELCFCPKLMRARALAEAGAVGRVFQVKQIEAHAGPYSDWFFDAELAGGGALMDMGCHSIEYARWMYGKAPVRRVTARMASYLHAERGSGVEDHVTLLLEWDGDRSALLESGWTLHGGMESKARIQGTKGVLDVDLLGSSGLTLFSLEGVAQPDAMVMPGWTKPDCEWLRQNGYPQEMEEFARAIREGRQPSESAEDGRAVLEIMLAAYASAAEGRTIELPYRPPAGLTSPVAPWLAAKRSRTA